MKALLLYACERVEELLRLKERDPKSYDTLVKFYNIQSCGQWER